MLRISILFLTLDKKEKLNRLHDDNLHNYSPSEYATALVFENFSCCRE